MPTTATTRSNGAALARQEAAQPAAAPSTAESRAAVMPIYDAFRRQIEHEDGLLSSRSSWLLLAQSFLVTGYCILFQHPSHYAMNERVTAVLAVLLPLTALATTVGLGLALAGGVAAIRTLTRQFEQLVTADTGLASAALHCPPIHTRGSTLWLGHAPVIGLPVLYAVFWLAMLAVQAA